jgi:hypothetical protein
MKQWAGGTLITGTSVMVGANGQDARVLLALPFGLAWIATAGYSGRVSPSRARRAATIDAPLPSRPMSAGRGDRRPCRSAAGWGVRGWAGGSCRQRWGTQEISSAGASAAVTACSAERARPAVSAAANGASPSAARAAATVCPYAAATPAEVAGCAGRGRGRAGAPAGAGRGKRVRCVSQTCPS